MKIERPQVAKRPISPWCLKYHPQSGGYKAQYRDFVLVQRPQRFGEARSDVDDPDQGACPKRREDVARASSAQGGQTQDGVGGVEMERVDELAKRRPAITAAADHPFRSPGASGRKGDEQRLFRVIAMRRPVGGGRRPRIHFKARNRRRNEAMVGALARREQHRACA